MQCTADKAHVGKSGEVMDDSAIPMNGNPQTEIYLNLRSCQAEPAKKEAIIHARIKLPRMCIMESRSCVVKLKTTREEVPLNFSNKYSMDFIQRNDGQLIIFLLNLFL